jgi:hypothetical protein
MHLPVLVVLLACFLFLRSECSKVSLCLSITDIKINKSALDTSERFEAIATKRRVRHATTTAAWKRFIPNSEVTFIGGVLKDPTLFARMLDLFEKGLVYSLFPLKRNVSLFFAYDASLPACDRVIYAVTFPQTSAKRIVDFEKWFDNHLWKGFDTELVTNPQHRLALMPALLNSVVNARRFGRNVRSGIYSLGQGMTLPAHPQKKFNEASCLMQRLFE